MIDARQRVLVAYSRVGGGHLSAAHALAAELESTGRVSTKLVDAYVDAGRFPLTQFPRIYARLARHHPRAWAAVYTLSNRGLDPKRVLGPFLRSGLRRVIRREQPALIISALPVVNGLLAEAARQVGARLEVVLTDWHSVHRFWVAGGVNYYTAPTDSARLDCIRFGAPPEHVGVVGIPVARSFAEARTHDAGLLLSLGLTPDRFTVLAIIPILSPSHIHLPTLAMSSAPKT